MQLRPRSPRPLRDPPPGRPGFACAALACLGLSIAPPCATAAQPPDAGRLLESTKPAAPPPTQNPNPLPEAAPSRPALAPGDASLKVRLSQIEVSGSSVFPAGELQALLRDAIGTELDFAGLQALADRITAHYREQGYLLARAYLPAQDLRDGKLEIGVLEGRLGRIAIDLADSARLTEHGVRERLGDLIIGQPLRSAPLERDLLLLSDLPATQVQSTLQPGSEVGTSDLAISVSGGPWLAGYASADNEGSRYTGANRVGAGLDASSPLRLGDALSLRVLDAGPGFAFGRLAWQVPLGGSGLQAGAAYAALHYRLGADFASLRAHGTAGIASVYASYPLVRSRGASLDAQLGVDHKRLDDAVDSTAVASRKNIDVWAAGLAGDLLDDVFGGGQNHGLVSLVSGRLGLDAASRAIDAAGHATAGSYLKVVAQASRTQRLDDAWSLAARITTQQAQKNLDSSEKLSLGGSQGVRAYPEDEAPSDDAWLSALELHYASTPNWQMQAFVDAADGRLNHHAIAADGTTNHRRLSGVGAALAYTLPGNFSVQATLAWRTGAAPTSDHDHRPRLWLQAVKSF